MRTESAPARKRTRATALAAALVVAFATAAAAVDAHPRPPQTPQREFGTGLVRFHGKGAEAWHWRATVAERRIARLERQLRRRWRPTTSYALRLAATVYGVPESQLRAVAWCESRFSPFARNPSGASGLFQFMPSTWRGNPIGRAGFSVWDPVAASLGAAAHVRRHGWGAWVCRS